MAMSPMMQQYQQIKAEHKDHIVFFRLGDFYEMFFDDAKLASKELEHALTGRDCGLEERAPMCGVPYHSCEAYIERLIKKGYKIAICEQVEDPKEAKGIVRREVVRIVTPGTLTENNMLDEGRNNFIASIYEDEQSFGVAVSDVSTGEVHTTMIPVGDTELLKNELSRFSPREIVFNTTFLSRIEMGKFIREKINCCAEVLTDDIYHSEDTNKIMLQQFDIRSRERAGLDQAVSTSFALIGLLYYLHQTQKLSVSRLVSLQSYSESGFMNLDISTRRNLELTQTMRTGERRGSLLWVIDKTRTAMGKRLMRLYLEQPLANPVYIDNRLNAVEAFVENTMLRMDIGDTLSGIYDIERLMTKVVCRSATPRELKSLEAALSCLPRLKELLTGVKANFLTEIYSQLSSCEEVTALIRRAIADTPPATIKDGHYINDGYDPQLDELRGILSNTKGILAAIEQQEREKTGIKNLRISYNKVFGYYMEVTKSYQNLVPPSYIRKQTLANCERYITDELKQLEEKILTANERIIYIENALYNEVLDDIAARLQEISASAAAVARLDVIYSFAQMAVDNHYVRPEISPKGKLIIKDGRHPVVERIMGTDSSFIPNDTLLDNGEHQIAIITGPNMAGKSTYIRQVAVICLMAHIGSFVPARSATIPIIDGIYTRVGASDDLASGQSTFMVEMSEVAHILKNATKDSLLILDEVGRGTSTFDGMSIARGVLEYIGNSKKLGAKTLFATHYHELTELEEQMDCVKNYNTAVKKRGEDIIFLRKIVPGGIDQSYGIEVSKLAGIPDWIIKRAREILKELEANNHIHSTASLMEVEPPQSMMEQTSMIPAGSPVLEALLEINLDTLTPIEALTKLYQLKSMAKNL